MCKKASAKSQVLRGTKPNLTNVANMKIPKLNNNPVAFSHTLKNILKSGKN